MIGRVSSAVHRASEPKSNRVMCVRQWRPGGLKTASDRRSVPWQGLDRGFVTVRCKESCGKLWRWITPHAEATKPDELPDPPARICGKQVNILSGTDSLWSFINQRTVVNSNYVWNGRERLWSCFVSGRMLSGARRMLNSAAGRQLEGPTNFY